MEINEPFTMVVLIVLIAVGAGVVNNYIKMKARREEGSADQEELHRLRQDVERLTERVRVLETIATDKDERLRDEISRLA
ncbi:hypothetical protein [Henriciella aquimarina]|uniref:hypothetical protein n=1 Tax=Henriciella aquimarina TaxID=545261 RepID=UPI001F2CFC1F|nr:hypothetical protein [Henriciella aquimarina]